MGRSRVATHRRQTRPLARVRWCHGKISRVALLRGQALGLRLAIAEILVPPCVSDPRSAAAWKRSVLLFPLHAVSTHLRPPASPFLARLRALPAPSSRP